MWTFCKILNFVVQSVDTLYNFLIIQVLHIPIPAARSSDIVVHSSPTEQHPSLYRLAILINMAASPFVISSLFLIYLFFFLVFLPSSTSLIKKFLSGFSSPSLIIVFPTPIFLFFFFVSPSVHPHLERTKMACFILI